MTIDKHERDALIDEALRVAAMWQATAFSIATGGAFAVSPVVKAAAAKQAAVAAQEKITADWRD